MKYNIFKALLLKYSFPLSPQMFWENSLKQGQNLQKMQKTGSNLQKMQKTGSKTVVIFINKL